MIQTIALLISAAQGDHGDIYVRQDMNDMAEKLVVFINEHTPYTARLGSQPSMKEVKSNIR